MGRNSTKLLKAALSALHYSGADGLIAPFTSGNGVIFMLHRVTPEEPGAFEPNRILKVTPEFLEGVILQVKAAGFDIISLDDVPERLKASQSSPQSSPQTAHPSRKPFAVFTLDDGYRDNAEYAYPVFKRYGVPFTIYIPTDYADGKGDLWWLTLEEAVRRSKTITVDMDGARRQFLLDTVADKNAAFDALYWWMRGMPEGRARAITQRLAREAGVDSAQLCRDLIMTWNEIRALASDPLVTIAAHSKSHYALAKLPEDEARSEIADSVARIESELGMPCRHFSYPYGAESSAGEREFAIAAELGLATAVTTRKGLLHHSHKDALTALPRLSLNGDFQDPRYIKVLLSGAPFAFLNAIQKVAAPLRTSSNASPY